MKQRGLKGIYTICIACALSIFMACEENERLVYALDDRVYFHETEEVLSVEKNVWEKNYSFALQPSMLMEDTIYIETWLMGRLADHDRTFCAIAVPDSTTAVSPTHYEILNGVIPAHEYKGYLPILIKRTEDTKVQSVSLYLEITNGGELAVGNADAIHFRLSWGDILMRPAHWPYYFGVYSNSKYQFAIEVLGLTDWPQADRFSNGSEPGLYTSAQLQLFASQLNEHYAEYRKTHAPIYVDDKAEEKVEIHYSPET